MVYLLKTIHTLIYLFILHVKIILSNNAVLQVKIVLLNFNISDFLQDELLS
ncbi:hypothetical protein PROFFT_A_04830 [Candidatus Profftia tarda]|uniref:Uncharacterized protein n=1 Tax=Candidatus Profftia tarda TaxID=1177216 RepID=A0A8E4GIX8_9ENTR|nr:hypothetical protein PROFFT_A_04830 [Candidatus Profftia tarda]